MLSVKIHLFPYDTSINSSRISTAENIQNKKKKNQWSLSKEKTQNDKLIFYTLETFVTVFYGLVSGSYANKVAPPRLIIMKDVQYDK